MSYERIYKIADELGPEPIALGPQLQEFSKELVNCDPFVGLFMVPDIPAGFQQLAGAIHDALIKPGSNKLIPNFQDALRNLRNATPDELRKAEKLLSEALNPPLGMGAAFKVSLGSVDGQISLKLSRLISKTTSYTVVLSESQSYAIKSDIYGNREEIKVPAALGRMATPPKIQR